MTNHKLSLAPFAEYVPFTNLYDGKQAKACLVKGWKDLHSNKAKYTVEDCPDNTWIQRRLRVRDELGNYIYCGFIIVDVDDQHWGDQVMNRIKEEKLIQYLKIYDNQFLYQKTGFILSHLKTKRELSDLFFSLCKEKAGKSSRYLSSDCKTGKFDAEWSLVVPGLLFQTKNGGLIDAGLQ